MIKHFVVSIALLILYGVFLHYSRIADKKNKTLRATILLVISEITMNFALVYIPIEVDSAVKYTLISQNTDTTTEITEITTITEIQTEIQKNNKEIVISKREQEPNNNTDTANYIDVNKTYSGNLFNEEDIDYYKISIASKGSININFNHEKIDTSDRMWSIQLLENDNDNCILEMFSNGGNSSEISNKVRIGPGDYYLKITSSYYSNKDYNFTLNFNSEDDTFEEENNSELSLANPIDTNKYYIGNLQDEDDVDYYTFTTTQKGKVNISFEHEKIDGGDIYWEIYLLDDISDSNILKFTSSGSEAKLLSDSVRIPAGKYYIKINDYYYENRDYQFKINFSAEDNMCETEPNNEISAANNIYSSNKYIGNIQTEEDVDYYKFEITQSRIVNIIFEHQKFEPDDNTWTITVMSGNSDDIIINENVSGNNVTTNLSLGYLPIGTYYIKISKYYYNNMDYSIMLI